MNIKKAIDFLNFDKRTYKAIARDTGISYYTLLSYFKGTRSPNLSTLEKLAAYFDIPLFMFLFYADEYEEYPDYVQKAIWNFLFGIRTITVTE